ncbi:DUF2634 domain-containing protein [Cohnella cholangitidis]|uniref:DUF2634 domain-containing protein n=1 Tax=Cohnella cholangitidis TaxID=2598458 RepID=A0A7G5C186_9BACL|nr:DUF2634 domain-containing protein [Cohnella cholangitidis]QMV42970.1 DUF2634 domain-containing protein [Cohnella cholangitidis]
MANLFPTSDIPEEPAIVETDNVIFGRSWRFDFDAGEFVLTPTGKVASSEGADAWVEWCKKALQTERFRYLVYSRDYGQEFNDLIRSGLSRPVIEMEIQRIATETLMVDPRTASVDGFVYEWAGDQCNFTCEISNVHEQTAEIQGSVVNA